MRRAPLRIRTFLVATFVGLLLLPALAGGAAFQIERDRQEADIQGRVKTAGAYLAAHRTGLRNPAVMHGFARMTARLDLFAQLVVATDSPPSKNLLYASPALSPALQQESARRLKARLAGQAVPKDQAPAKTPWADRQVSFSIGTEKPRATLVADFFYPPPSRAAQALVALVTGVLVLLLGLAVAVWLAGRWMVAPLAALSAQVDGVAGGDLEIDLPGSRIAEVANVAQAIAGMTAALGETARQRAEADEARRFLVTSVAHDLRTPLFALRGHLQAIRSRLGDPTVHLERAEARAAALERLIANLFAYARDDYAQQVLRLEPIPVGHLFQEVTADLEHSARVGGNSVDLAGDETLAAVVDRDRARRALTNILDNALRYSPPGARIEVSWIAVDEETIETTIRDHGPGIDPNLLPHIFEPGIRGQTSADPDGGAGLGLAIAIRLLESQHAAVTARNHPAGGAAFTVTLRRARLLDVVTKPYRGPRESPSGSR